MPPYLSLEACRHFARSRGPNKALLSSTGMERAAPLRIFAYGRGSGGGYGALPRARSGGLLEAVGDRPGGPS